MLEDIQNQLERSLFKQNPEKTSIDKVLGRGDIAQIQELMKKEKLTRADILVLTALMSGMEAKLFNLSTHERGVLLKFFVWIGEFVKVGERNYDVEKKVKESMDITKIEKYLDNPRAEYEPGEIPLDVDISIYNILQRNEATIEHIFKYLTNLYLNVCRTSLSQGGAAFKSVLEQKYDIQYRHSVDQNLAGGPAK